MATMDNAEVLLAKAQFAQRNIALVANKWGEDSELVEMAKEQFEHYFNLASEAYNQVLGETMTRVEQILQQLH
jgi:hypothetical protein